MLGNSNRQVMIALNKDRLLSTSLRLISLASKLLLISFLAKNLTTSEVSIYGNFAALVGFSVTLLGMEIYQYSLRLYAGECLEKRVEIMRKHLSVLVTIGGILLPLALYIAWLSGVPVQLLAYFAVIAILELLTQEQFRFLIASDRQVSASIILFLRSALWIIAYILLEYFELIQHDLTNLFTCWIFSNLIAVFYGIKKVDIIIVNNVTIKYDVSEWKRQLKVGLGFFVTAILSKIMFTFDRTLIVKNYDENTAAVYMLNIGVAMGVLSLVEASKLSFEFPKIISVVKSKNHNEIKKYITKSMFETALYTALLCVVIYNLYPFLLNYIGRAEYGSGEQALKYLLLAIFFYCVSVIPHYYLYAQQRDKTLLIVQGLSTVVFIFFGYFMSINSVQDGVPIAIFAALTIQLVMKTVLWWRN